MRIIFEKIRLRQEIDSIKILFWLLMLVTLTSCLVDFFNKYDFTLTLIEFVSLAIFFRFFHKILKELYYTYWTFVVILALYLIHGFWMSLTVTNSLSVFYLNTLGIIFLSLQSYILFSPIYFPIVNWWEYDFRFRDELKVTLNKKDSAPMEGRLTDLRKRKGCIVLFEDLNIGDQLKIKLQNYEIQGDLFIEIMSKRLYSFGRPYNYGVKFVLNQTDGDAIFQQLARYWKTERRSKLKLKYNGSLK